MPSQCPSAAILGGEETLELLFEIHQMVTDGTLDDPTAAGRFRRSDEDICVGDDSGEIFHIPPAADELEGRLSEMCRFANGTTPQGFIHPLVRSIILHFWLAYDHPFVDGNGRIARILMNAELDAANQSRIIIPTVFCEDYFLALRKLSRKLDPGPYVRMLSYAQQFTAALSYEEYSQTLAQLQACNAFLEPNEGKLIFYTE